MKKSPLELVKERFTDKNGLAKAVEDLTKGDLWIDRVNSDKGLERISNRKLLHLHEVLSAVKSQFGSRNALVDAIAEQEKRAADAGYKARLGRYGTPRLWEIYRAARKRTHSASA
jgi:hypothetical protein